MTILGWTEILKFGPNVSTDLSLKLNVLIVL